MAVQLARLSLWLATLAADRPLTFLDHHLQAGDSLLGAWLSTSAPRRPAPRARPADSPSRCRSSTRRPVGGRPRERAADSLLARVDARTTRSKQVRAKERALAALEPARYGALALEAGRRSLVRVLVRRDGTPMPRRRRSARCPTPILTGPGALPAAHRAVVICGIARRRRARATVSSTGSSSFRKSFFDADGAPPRERRLRRRPRQSAVGHDARRRRIGRRPRRSRGATIAPVLRFTRDAGVYTRAVRAATPTAISSSSSGRSRSRAAAGASASSCRRASRPITAARALRRRLLSALRRRRARRLRQPARHLSHSPQRPVSAADRHARVANPTRSPAGSASAIPPCSKRRATTRRRTSAWFPVRLTPRSASTGCPATTWRFRISGRRPTSSIAERAAALFPPLGDERGWARALRPRAERHRRPRRISARPARGLPVVEGKQIEPFRVRRRAARARHRRRATPRAAARSVAIRAAAARLPRRRERHQPPDAHRRHPAGALRLDAHGLLPADAAAARARSTSSAGCSTASSSTTWFGCA